MNEDRTTIPASANSLATSEILRMFSSRSSGLKPRFLFRPWSERKGRGRGEGKGEGREGGEGRGSGGEGRKGRGGRGGEGRGRDIEINKRGGRREGGGGMGGGKSTRSWI